MKVSIMLILLLFVMGATLAPPIVSRGEAGDRLCLTMPTDVCDGGAD